MSKHFEQRTAYLRKAGRETRETTSISGNNLGVVSQSLSIYSDGVRLSATIWHPDKKSEEINTSSSILLSWWLEKNVSNDGVLVQKELALVAMPI